MTKLDIPTLGKKTKIKDIMDKIYEMKWRWAGYFIKKTCQQMDKETNQIAT